MARTVVTCCGLLEDGHSSVARNWRPWLCGALASSWAIPAPFFSEFGNHCFRAGNAPLPPGHLSICAPDRRMRLLFRCTVCSFPPAYVCAVLPACLPTSQVPLGFPFSLPGISVGPHGSLLLLGVLGSNSICGCNQRHCAGEVAVFLKALSPLAQETDPK